MSVCLQDVIPKNHLASFKLTENEMQLIQPEDVEETERLLAVQREQRQSLGAFVRAVDTTKRSSGRPQSDNQRLEENVQLKPIITAKQ